MEQTEKRKKVSSEIFDWVESIVFALVIVVLLFTFVFRIVRVDGKSMYPTLNDSDRIIIGSAFYTPEQGDIVVTVQSNYFGEPLIKRVIAVEGQTIDIDPDTGAVTIDGVPYEDEHAYFASDAAFNIGDAYTYPLVVEEGKVFCMGDNRNHSSDSRSSLVGMIDVDSILGKTMLRIYPLSEFGLV